MKEIVLGFATAFIVVLMATPSLITVARLKHLVDEPTEARKLHHRSVPTIGGIIIFAATLFGYSLWFPSEYTLFFGSVYSFSVSIKEFKYIVAATILLFFTGVKDDIIGMAPVKKLVSHGLVAFILVIMSDIRITGLYGIFGVEQLPYYASVFLSIFTYIVVVNAFNLIDGVDGLATGVGILASVLFGTWFLLSEQTSLALLSFTLCGSLCAFLIFNFSPARIFMGDSGSLFIGAIMYFLAVKCTETASLKLPGLLQDVTPPVFAMCVLSYPLTDTLRVFVLRAIRGQSPLSADRNHIHHRVLDVGRNHAKTCYILWSCAALVPAVSLLTHYVVPTAAFIIMLAFSIVAYGTLTVIPRRKVLAK